MNANGAKEKPKKHKKREGKGFTWQEVLVLLLVAALAAAVAAVAIVNFLASKGEESESVYDEIAAAFAENGEDGAAIEACGRHLLPEEDGSYYVFFRAQNAAELVSADDIEAVSGYVDENGCCCIYVVCSYGSGVAAGYSETLEEDVAVIGAFFATGDCDLVSTSLELRFAYYLLAQTYADTCAMEDGTGYRFTADGKEETENFSAFARLVVCGALSDATIAQIRSFTSLQEISIPDSGVYTVTEEGIYDNSGTVLLQAYPFLTAYTRPSKVFALADGCFAGCTKLESVDIPFCGQSMLSLFAAVPDSLKQITFSQYTYGSMEKGIFDGCQNVEGIRFCEGFRRFGKGLFSGLTSLKSLVFADDTEYFYLSGDAVSVTAPSSAVRYDG